MELKINESKVLEFNTIIEGGNADDLSGTFIINIDNIEYGFPVSLNDKKIQAKIPPLKDYVKEENLRRVKSAFARLDIVAKGKLFTPWKEDINIEIPLEVKAEMTDIKGFLKEADNIIKISKVEEKTVKKTKTEGKYDKVDEDEDLKKGSKKKSKFSIMLEVEEKKCPEGQKY